MELDGSSDESDDDWEYVEDEGRDDTEWYWDWVESKRTPPLYEPERVYESPLFHLAYEYRKFITESENLEDWPIESEDRCQIHDKPCSDGSDDCDLCLALAAVENLHLIADAWTLMGGAAADVEAEPLLDLLGLNRAWDKYRKTLGDPEEWLELSGEGRHIKAQIVHLVQQSRSPGADLDPSSWKMSDDWKKRTQNKPKPRRVRFDETTDFANDALIARDGDCYLRSSSLYCPGKNACPNEEGWEDHSWERNWVVSLAQCKVYFTPTLGRREYYLGQLCELKDASMVIQTITLRMKSAARSLPHERRVIKEAMRNCDTIHIGVRAGKGKNYLRNIKFGDIALCDYQTDRSDVVRQVRTVVLTRAHTARLGYLTPDAKDDIIPRRPVKTKKDWKELREWVEKDCALEEETLKHWRTILPLSRPHQRTNDWAEL
ncbi:uncharacterized protein EI97DRAFT_454980 [Westerdykella ornata]|uniref:Uncharacterized protein n=1 Tax=Westerdykella ornata TaxID=318751 RepID=A0A6A6JTZ3_WESOR|nr:uncharacterized protein EI97DRAFT_454980 [Westerdykella ornata]KAF2280052.1 hypothetical protein EI97DRAFT_454980 [Westerdykella ornata]